MTITGIIEGKSSASPGDIWTAVTKKIIDNTFDIQNVGEDSCSISDFNFYAKDILPNHVLEQYDKFTRFISLFYKFLECNQDLGYLSVIKDIDETPDVLIKLFKDTYAAGFPDKTLIDSDEVISGNQTKITVVDFLNPEKSKLNVRNFLRYVRDFYQLKSVEEAYDFFFRVFFNEEVLITYPKIYLHKCSEGAYIGGESGGYTADPYYYWGDRFTELDKYENYPDCRDETLEDPFSKCVPIPFPEYGPTGGCYFNSDNQLCWGPGGSYDSEGNLLYPPCEPGCAAGKPHGVNYENDFGTLSGLSKIPDNKTWQNYSYMIDSEISWDLYLDYVHSILHPAGLHLVGNYIVSDTFSQVGTTGDVTSVEQPVVGNYTPYRFNTSVNLRNNASSVDLYPCGWLPYLGGTANGGGGPVPEVAEASATATIIGSAALAGEDGTNFILINADGSTVTFHTDPTKNFGDTSSDGGHYTWELNTGGNFSSAGIRKATQALWIACKAAIDANELDMTIAPTTVDTIADGSQVDFTLTQTTAGIVGNTAITLITGVEEADGETTFTGGINGVAATGAAKYAGVTYSTDHIQDSFGLWYKNEAGLTAHEPRLAGVTAPAGATAAPLGLTGHTGGLAAQVVGATGLLFFRIFHHPNTWTTTVPDGITFGGIEIGWFSYLEAINSGKTASVGNTASPNNPTEATAGCGFPNL